MELFLEAASAADAPLIQNLMQLYTHDFSEFWADTERGDLGPDGRFADYPLAAYWQQAGRRAYLLRVCGRLAGFALVNRHSRASLHTDHAVAEFFVVRKYRRRRVGRRAAALLFGSGSGQWEVAVARKNLGALAFWRSVVSGFAAAHELSEIDLDGPDWDGPIIRFRT